MADVEVVTSNVASSLMTSSTAVSVSFTPAVGANRKIFISVQAETAIDDDPSGITYGGASIADQLVYRKTVNSDLRMHLYMVTDSNETQKTVAASFSTSRQCRIIVFQVNNTGGIRLARGSTVTTIGETVVDGGQVIGIGMSVEGGLTATYLDGQSELIGPQSSYFSSFVSYSGVKSTGGTYSQEFSWSAVHDGYYMVFAVNPQDEIVKNEIRYNEDIVSGSIGTGTTAYFGVTEGSNRIVVAVVYLSDASETLTGATIDGDAMTLVSNDGASDKHAYVYMRTDSDGLSTGTRQLIQVTATGSANKVIVVFQIDNAKQAYESVDSIGSTCDVDNSPALDYSVSELKSIVFGFADIDSSISCTPSSGQDVVLDSTGSSLRWVMLKREVGDGSGVDEITFGTSSSYYYGYVLVSFSPNIEISQVVPLLSIMMGGGAL